MPEISGDRRRTMTIVPEGQIRILPPKEGACWLCGDVHNGRDPHNAGSLLYQHRFRKRNGRYPTWADAMSHCSRKTKEKWVERLSRKGIRISMEEVMPKGDGRQRLD